MVFPIFSHRFFSFPLCSYLFLCFLSFPIFSDLLIYFPTFSSLFLPSLNRSECLDIDVEALTTAVSKTRRKQARGTRRRSTARLGKFYRTRSRLYRSFFSIKSFKMARRSRRHLDSQSGMPALRIFSVGHFAAKLAWSLQISLSNPSRGNPCVV